ncbi:sugar ABC transporter permease [Nonomuraea typhae]|uniref:sugar ABC transporter permease n=1 Tax=Nonomuraea typhae TaxID=2603600 RepID=UPI0012FBD794|nr:sugar ABC transporter permease [Nonomuraea typhae]
MTWAERTLDALLDRAGTTEAAVAPRWPLFADPRTGDWTTTARGSWTGGFWAGLLGLRAALSGDPADRAAASGRTAALAPWIGADTAARGMIFWYGTAFAETELRQSATEALLAAYDPVLGVVPWGAAFGGPRDLARVDSLPGLVPLLGGSGAPGLRAMRGHLDRHLDLLTRGGRPVPAWRVAPDGGWVPHPEPPAGWSRTVPWLTLALADADRLAPGRAHETLSRLTASRPDGPPDTSATAIHAAGLLKLAGTHENARLRDQAARMLRGLVTDHVRDGRLLDGCYDLHRGLATRHELVWGDFFLALGLAMLTGAIDPFTC